MTAGAAAAGTGLGGPFPPVLVVDDEETVRGSVAALLAAAGVPVETFEDWPSLMARRRDDAGPAILLADIRLGRGDGLSHYAALREAGDLCPVIFMTAYADVGTAVAALRLQATDFLEKPFSRAQLFAALERARRSLATVPQGDAAREAIEGRRETLSPREEEVFRAMAAGWSTKEIARRLGISPRTVEVHRSRVMHKMEADSLATLVRMAIALNLPPPSGPAA